MSDAAQKISNTEPAPAKRWLAAYPNLRLAILGFAFGLVGQCLIKGTSGLLGNVPTGLFFDLIDTAGRLVIFLGVVAAWTGFVMFCLAVVCAVSDYFR